MNAYIVMAHTNYVNAFNVPSPVAVFDKRKQAEDFADEKNKRSRRNTYYVRPAKDMRTAK